MSTGKRDELAVFYSFHYQRDAWRVQGIMQMGAVEGQPLLNAQEWEAVKRQGKQAIENWVDRQMRYKRAVVVLVGAETACRPWVQYEIRKAWRDRYPLVGIRIHGMADSTGSTGRRGANPFARVPLTGGGTVADHVPLHDPAGRNSQAVYGTVKANLERWVRTAYRR